MIPAASIQALIAKSLERWRQRYKAVTSVVDRCDSARAYEIQNFVANLEELEALAASAPPRSPDSLSEKTTDMLAQAHGEGQEHTIADVNAGLIDDLIEPRLARERCGYDHGMLAVALREWARLIRLADNQQTLLDIADDIDVNAKALEPTDGNIDDALKLLQASPASPPRAWQAIETAPKMTYVLLFYRGHIDIACFHTARNKWQRHGRTLDAEPSHWMPLPDPPSGAV